LANQISYLAFFRCCIGTFDLAKLIELLVHCGFQTLMLGGVFGIGRRGALMLLEVEVSFLGHSGGC
jgi:nitrogen regulatory protein PII